MYEYMHEWINEQAVFLFLPMLLKKLFFRYFMIFDRNKASRKEVSFIMRKSSRWKRNP